MSEDRAPRHSLAPVTSDPAPAPPEAPPPRAAAHPAWRRVFVDRTEVHLTPTEYRLLVVLVKNAGRAVTQRQLLRDVWGPRSPERNRHLHVYMTYLRRKLEPDPRRPRLFATEPGVGYRLREPGADAEG